MQPERPEKEEKKEEKIINDDKNTFQMGIPTLKPMDRKEKWTFSTSIFKDYKKDSDELLEECFEVDWANTRIPKIIKEQDDLILVKEIWASRYKQYKDCYKYFASINPAGDIWAISTLPFWEFINKCEILDQKKIQQQDVNLKFVATLSAPQHLKNNPRKPERALSRFQLMEVITRLADEMYIRQGICSSFSEAVSLILRDHCDKVFNQYDSQKWRDERYWNEECDRVLTFYYAILENVYLNYSVKKKKSGEKNFMCLDELNIICQECNLYENKNFAPTDVQISFNLAIMTQSDELNQDRIFQMSFIEFLEAISRIADNLSLSPVGSNPADWTYERRVKLKLCYKLEAFIMILLESVADSHIEEIFTGPPVFKYDKMELD